MINIEVIHSQRMNLGAHKGKLIALVKVDTTKYKTYEEFVKEALNKKVTDSKSNLKYLIKGVERPFIFVGGQGDEMGLLLEEIK